MYQLIGVLVLQANKLLLGESLYTLDDHVFGFRINHSA